MQGRSECLSWILILDLLWSFTFFFLAPVWSTRLRSCTNSYPRTEAHRPHVLRRPCSQKNKICAGSGSRNGKSRSTRPLAEKTERERADARRGRICRENRSERTLATRTELQSLLSHVTQVSAHTPHLSGVTESESVDSMVYKTLSVKFGLVKLSGSARFRAPWWVSRQLCCVTPT